MKLKVLELFGGIGACSKALERLGVDFTIVDYVEIDKYAVKSFNAMHDTNFEPQDIREWDKDVDVDLIMHGSPCQDFSSVGLGAGGDKGSGTRSSLMYETIRIVEKLRPKYVIWENVKNLLSKKHKHNFDAYLETMEQLGYKNYYQVLNAKDYGIPQNRERIFTVSVRQDVDRGYTFPAPQKLELEFKDMLEDNVDDKYFITKPNEALKETLRKNVITKDVTYIDSYNRKFRDDNLAGTITTRVSASNGTFLAIKDGDNIKIRKFLPLETWVLMGFSRNEFKKARDSGVSDAQLYKQAGNSIVVNVLVAILKELLLNE